LRIPSYGHGCPDIDPDLSGIVGQSPAGVFDPFLQARIEILVSKEAGFPRFRSAPVYGPWVCVLEGAGQKFGLGQGLPLGLYETNLAANAVLVSVDPSLHGLEDVVGECRAMKATCS